MCCVGIILKNCSPKYKGVSKMINLKRALIVSHVASMIDLFNRRNIKILQNMGYEVHIACNFEEGNVTSQEQVRKFHQEMRNEGVKCHDIPFPRKVLTTNVLKSYKEMAYLMNQYRYEIVHCQAPISGVITRLAARKFRRVGTKVIYVAHGFHFLKGGPIKNWILYYPVEYICSRFTDCIVTINQEDYRRARGFYKRGRGHVEFIPGVGIDTEKFKNDSNNREEILSSFGISVDSKVVVTVGELVPGKNHATGLKAFAKANLQNTYYVICGIGRYERELRRLVASLNLQEKVIFMGYCSNINEIHHASNVFLFPSKREGLPVAVMEAMAAGLPVICSDVRGNRDLIVDVKGGFVLDKYDVEGFAEAIKWVINNEKDLENMGHFNADRIKNYDNKFVDKMMGKIYRSVLA